MGTPESPELPEEVDLVKQCHKCEEQLLDNLNIVHNGSSSLVITWNRFQIFVYEDLDLKSPAKVFIPEFQVCQLIILNNYLVCLDTSGNIHTTSMKFKNPAQKRVKSSFQPREQNVLVCMNAEDNILSLTHELDSYFFLVNKVNADFTLEKKISLLYKGRWPLPRPTQDKCLLASYKLTETQLDYVRNLFNVNKNTSCSDCSLIVITFDKFTIYGCLFSPKMSEDNITLVKLYTCPSEICNFEIVNLDQLYIIIGLKIGTLVRLSPKNVSMKPELLHLNIALHKFKMLKDTLIYTDGRSMWKADDTFTDKLSFLQFFIRHVKDFIKVGDQIICTTYTDLLYIFPIDDDSSYLKPDSIDGYCSAEKLLNNSECLHKIIEELEKNNELTKRINDEGNFVTAMSLSNRQDIMDNIIQHNVTVHDSYEDVKTETTNILLTENMAEYFKPHTFHILVKLSTTTLHHMFNNILSNVFNDVKIHITLATEMKVLKTTSVKVIDSFKKMNILIPIYVIGENVSELKVHIELISSIPGAFDEAQKLWITLYRKQVILNSEHFIKIVNKSDGINKESHESVEDLVLKVSQAQFGSAFKFTDMKKHYLVPENCIYLKLPPNYKDLFKKETNALDYLNKIKVAQLMKSYTADDFLKAKSNIIFEIVDEKVKIEVLSDEFTSPILKVSCRNMAVAFHIRNLFSKIIYEDFINYKPGKEYVKYVLYNKTEILQKEIKSCMLKQLAFNVFQPHADNFERSIIGALPL